jgi:hypothetical protein
VAAQPAASSQPQHGSMQGLHVRFIDPRASSRQRFRRIGTPTKMLRRIWRSGARSSSHAAIRAMAGCSGAQAGSREQGQGGWLAGWLPPLPCLVLSDEQQGV